MWLKLVAGMVGLAPAFCATGAVAQDRFDIAITVDDLPGIGKPPADTTRKAIALSYVHTLRAHSVPQAFGFVNAHKVADAPVDEVVLAIWRKAGYSLGNHADTHMNLVRAPSLQAWQQDVINGEQLVARHMRGRNWHFFRYPNLTEGSGALREQASAFLRRRGYRVAHVSVSFDDWAYTEAYNRCIAKHDEASIAAMKRAYLALVDQGILRFKAVSRRLYGRVIPQVLLTHLGGWQAYTLPDVLARLEAAGARYVPLERAVSDPAYAEAEAVSGGGITLERVAKNRNIDLSGVVNPHFPRDLAATCQS